MEPQLHHLAIQMTAGVPTIQEGKFRVLNLSIHLKKLKIFLTVAQDSDRDNWMVKTAGLKVQSQTGIQSESIAWKT